MPPGSFGTIACMSTPCLRAAAALIGLAGLFAAAAQAADCPPAPPAIDAARLAQLKAGARDRGPLWRVAKALEASDVLAVEIDLTDTGAIKAALPKPPARAPLQLEPALQQRIDAALDNVCAAPPVRALPTALQVMVLTLLDARREGLYGEF